MFVFRFYSTSLPTIWRLGKEFKRSECFHCRWLGQYRLKNLNKIIANMKQCLLVLHLGPSWDIIVLPQFTKTFHKCNLIGTRRYSGPTPLLRAMLTNSLFLPYKVCISISHSASYRSVIHNFLWRKRGVRQHIALSI